MFTKLKKIVVGVARELHKAVTRSPEWPRIRREHLKLHPMCAACGGTRLLQVHHKQPFHLKPELELEPTNLITLCMGNLCHIEIGHGDDFKALNPNVQVDATRVFHFPLDRPVVVAAAKKKRLYAEPPKMAA